jgi:hypothetical protein
VTCDKCRGRLLPHHDLDSDRPVAACINCGWVPGLRREPTDRERDAIGWKRRPVSLPIRPLSPNEQRELIDDSVTA